MAAAGVGQLLGGDQPAWFDTFMGPAEFLFMAVFFWMLGRLARKKHTDTGFLGKLNLWIITLGVLFAVFTPLAYGIQKGFMTIFGAVYLLMMGAAVGIILKMRETIEAV